MTSDALALTILTAGVGAATVIDLRTRRIPNALTASLAGAGLLLAATGLGRIGVIAALAGGLAGVLLMLPGHIFGGTGGGDVKLLGAVGTLLGPGDTFRACLVAMIAGAVLAVIVAVRRGRLRQSVGRSIELVTTAGGNVAQIDDPRANSRFAYAPAIAVGAFVAGAWA